MNKKYQTLKTLNTFKQKNLYLHKAKATKLIFKVVNMFKVQSSFTFSFCLIKATFSNKL